MLFSVRNRWRVLTHAVAATSSHNHLQHQLQVPKTQRYIPSILLKVQGRLKIEALELSCWEIMSSTRTKGPHYLLHGTDPFEKRFREN